MTFASQSGVARNRNRTTARRRFRPAVELLERRDVPSMFTVNTTEDGLGGWVSGGPGGRDGHLVATLRWAINQANANPGWDDIAFNIPPAGPKVIAISPALGPLPALQEQASIDGWSENMMGPFNQPIIGIDGSYVAGDGLVVAADNCYLQGLAIYDFNGNGVVITNPGLTSGTTIVGCNIGTDLSGTAAGVGNSGDGVLITGPGNHIFGNSAEPIVISGNGQNGVHLSGSAATGNHIYGSLIGLDGTGEAALANGGDGVWIEGGAASNIVGGGNAVTNFISGNLGNGVEISTGSSENVVASNYIGTDMSGTAALGNQGDGIYVTAPDNTMTGRKVSPK
jgi:hypothetical protein